MSTNECFSILLHTLDANTGSYSESHASTEYAEPHSDFEYSITRLRRRLHGCDGAGIFKEFSCHLYLRTVLKGLDRVWRDTGYEVGRII